MQQQYGFQQQAQPAPDLNAPLQVQQRMALMPNTNPPTQIQPILPPRLLNYSGYLLYMAINSIQEEAPINQLRTIFFNRISQNGYANAMFANYVEKLSEFFSLLAMTRPQIDPINLAREAVERFTQYKVCQMAMSDPGIGQYLPPNIMQACAQGMREFESLANALQQPQQQFGGQPSFGGSQTVGFQQQQQNVGAWPQAGGWPPRQPQGVSPGGMGSPSRYDFKNSNTAWPGPAPTPHQDAFAGAQGWQRTVGAGLPPAASPASAPAPQVSIIETPSVWVSPPAPNGNVFMTESTSAAPAQLTQPTQPQPAPASKIVEQLAYDHNLYELKEASTGGMVLVERPNVDRQRHLIRPRATPQWVHSSTIANSEERIERKEDNTPVVTMVDTDHSDLFTPVQSLEEAWSPPQASAQLTQSSKGIQVYRTGAMLYTALPASEAAVALVAGIRQLDCLEIAAGRVADALDNYRGKDVAYVAELNTRLTKAVNLVLSMKLSLQITIDDFAHDIVDLYKLLDSRYGTQVLEVLKSCANLILSRTITDPESEKGFQALLRESYPNLSDEEFAELHTYADDVALFSVNLSSIELRMELQNPEIGNVVLESRAPLAHAVVSTVMESKLAKLSSKVLLRTTDNVCYELTNGLFNKSAIVVKKF